MGGGRGGRGGADHWTVMMMIRMMLMMTLMMMGMMVMLLMISYDFKSCDRTRPPAALKRHQHSSQSGADLRVCCRSSVCRSSAEAVSAEAVQKQCRSSVCCRSSAEAVQKQRRHAGRRLQAHSARVGGSATLSTASRHGTHATVRAAPASALASSVTDENARSSWTCPCRMQRCCACLARSLAAWSLS
eukprot:30737-Rhodomonas_salina.1